MWVRLQPVLLAAALCFPAADLCLAAKQFESLDEVRREGNLEKRSRFALEYAKKALDRAIKTYLDGDPSQGLAILQQVQDAVELSKASLDETGKIPSRKPKHFKRAEIRTRRLLRELDNAERQVNFDDRERVRAVYERVEEINRELLLGIMTKPKK